MGASRHVTSTAHAAVLLDVLAPIERPHLRREHPPAFGVRESKLAPPEACLPLVSRPRLVELIGSAGGARVVVVAAPAGYGKTALLAEWSRMQDRPVVWLTLDEWDNEPHALLSGLAAAVSRAHRAGEPEGLGRSGRVTVAEGIDQVASALSATGPVQLVLDQLEAVHDEQSLRVVRQLATRLHPSSRLVIGTRTSAPLPIALLRSRGELLAVGVRELAMTASEAAELLEADGVHGDESLASALYEATEGWPVALHLGGLAVTDQPDGVAWSTTPRSTVPGSSTVRGDDRLIADYLRSEVLAGLDAPTHEFLRRTAVLDRLSGPLCDALLDSDGSQQLLESLEARNVLLVGLDTHQEWYRVHRLVRQLLQAELQRQEPDVVDDLHRRAADWFERHGVRSAALHHAQQARDHQRAGRLVTSEGPVALGSGRVDTLREWIEWFHAESVTQPHPGVAILGALAEATLGRPAGAERWMAVAEASPAASPERPRSIGAAARGWLSYARAFSCREGTEAMRQQAREAQLDLIPGAVLHAGAVFLEGMSFMLEGDHASAEPVFARAREVALDANAMTTAAAAIAERAVIALARSDWVDAAAFSDEARAIIEDHGLSHCIEATIVDAVAARTAIHRGDPHAARMRLDKAAGTRPTMTYAMPWTAQFQIELAKAHLALADHDGVKTALRTIRDILWQRGDLGVIEHEAHQLHESLQTTRQKAMGASALTAAELRLLPWLATHLSFEEIGGQLHISRHTVKSQAISIYRKLGASSRSEAIACVHEIGLLSS
jgi:LuxR family transcriptional regulator, maltose regulon positive regulatory protein